MYQSCDLRSFALGGVALGVAAMVCLDATPEIVKASGRVALFWVFAAIMGFAALVNTVFFPSVELTEEAPRDAIWSVARLP